MDIVMEPCLASPRPRVVCRAGVVLCPCATCHARAVAVDALVGRHLTLEALMNGGDSLPMGRA